MDMISTPVTETLHSNGISYRLLPHTRPVFTCEEAAAERHVPLSEMVKCLVFIDKNNKRALMACVPANKRVALGKLKQVSKMKAFSPATPEDIQQVTGFPRGSIPPIALPAAVTVIGDSSLLRKAKLNISSGAPTAGLELSAWDLRKVFRGTFAEITD